MVYNNYYHISSSVTSGDGDMVSYSKSNLYSDTYLSECVYGRSKDSDPLSRIGYGRIVSVRDIVNTATGSMCGGLNGPFSLIIPTYKRTLHQYVN